MKSPTRTGLSTATAQDAAKKPEAKKETKERKKPRGRLPNYYGEVVNEEQRTKIYEIQATYREKMEELRKQLAALKKEQDEKVNAVLTPEQRSTLPAARYYNVSVSDICMQY